MKNNNYNLTTCRYNQSGKCANKENGKSALRSAREFCVWRDLMKMEYALPQRDREQIEKFQKQIDEIKQEYIDEYLSHPFQDSNLERRFRSDGRVQILEKAIANIYTMSVGTYVITAETEEELRELKENLKSIGKAAEKI